MLVNLKPPENTASLGTGGAYNEENNEWKRSYTSSNMLLNNRQLAGLNCHLTATPYSICLTKQIKNQSTGNKTLPDKLADALNPVVTLCASLNLLPEVGKCQNAEKNQPSTRGWLSPTPRSPRAPKSRARLQQVR